MGSFKASMATYVSTVASDAVSVMLLTSGFASVLANLNIGARYLFTLGGDGVLPRKLGKVHPTQGSPYIAAAVFAVMCLIGSVVIPVLLGIEPLKVYVDMAAIGGVCLLLLMLTTSLAVLMFFRRTAAHTASVWKQEWRPHWPRSAWPSSSGCRCCTCQTSSERASSSPTSHWPSSQGSL